MMEKLQFAPYFPENRANTHPVDDIKTWSRVRDTFFVKLKKMINRGQ